LREGYSNSAILESILHCDLLFLPTDLNMTRELSIIINCGNKTAMAHPERRLLYSPGPDHLASSCWSWSLQAFCRDDIVLKLLRELWSFSPRIIRFLIPIVVIFGLVSSRASRDSHWTHKAALFLGIVRGTRSRVQPLVINRGQ
jgi:hypothetical protein